MILLHTSDWHLGMPIGSGSYRDDQLFFIDEVADIIRRERVGAVMLAGDVYDSGLVGGEAIGIWNEAATRICLECGVPMVVIAGNHDGADRLAACSELLKTAGLHIFGRLACPVRPVVLEEGRTAIWPLPFFQPDAVRALWGLEEVECRTQGRALQAVLDSIREGMGAYAFNVALAHTLTVSAELSDSDRSARIGGAGAVPASLFDRFDYAALGHIHKPQAVSPRVRYSGSPMAYSFGAEERQTKGVVLLDTQTGEQRFVPVRQLHPHVSLQAEYAQIADMQDSLRGSWLRLTVTDRTAGPELFGDMRERFPLLAELRGRDTEAAGGTDTLTAEQLDRMSDTDILLRFLEETGSPVRPTADQLRWFEQSMLAEGEEGPQ